MPNHASDAPMQVIHYPRARRASAFLNSFRWITLLSMVSAIVLAGTSCSSPKAQSQTSPAFSPANPPSSFIVIAVDERQFIRDTFEQQLAQRLKEHSVQTHISSPQFALADLLKGKEEIRQKLAIWKADAVIITKLAGKADASDPVPAAGGINFWHTGLSWGDVDNARLTLDGPGGDVRSALRLKSSVYQLETGALIWVGYTDMVLRESNDEISAIRSITRTIADQLAKDKIIP